MLTVAYLANQFPAAVESYIGDEIRELESRGVRVIAASVRQGSGTGSNARNADFVLMPISISILTRALWLCVRRTLSLAPFLKRIFFCGGEAPFLRGKALIHTFMGACLAERLKRSGVKHIHVHHGYFGSWIGMVAARLMGSGFSFTLHGSDLLLHGAYLDAKLAACNFCTTVSDYNREFIVQRFPWAEEKVVVSRLGVAEHNGDRVAWQTRSNTETFEILSVGRLHPVKDHAFLVEACARMLELGISFKCSIAGEGPQHGALEALVCALGLTEHVRLLGHVEHEKLGALYDRADAVVLTSRSEGIPVVLMEAMARGRIVLAPAITGIPELVIPDKTGFLYPSGSMEGFLNQLLFIRSATANEFRPEHEGTGTIKLLSEMRNAARTHVFENFNQQKNLQRFADLFLSRMERQSESTPNENLVLQQI